METLETDMVYYVVGAIVIAVVVFIAMREYVWWYFGIDRALEHLASIDESLKQLPAVKRHEFEAGRSSRRVA